ncbi:MAG: hypothetical protein KDB27_28630 [Planctomycetales bacterium]|nr:hypothetical protein [Planctomycetales bacterium]
MKIYPLTFLVALAAVLPSAQAGVAYKDPDGGWAYLYDGILDDESLDGTWDHDNGSDAWDGLGINEEDSAPGGVSALTEGDVNFLRIQDTGDPRGFAGIGDPSNRKMYFTHDNADIDPDGELIIEGVTLSFRTRLATTGLLDQEFIDVPEGGDGYYVLDGGKGPFGIRSDAAAGVITFSPATSMGDDLAENESGALLMNNYDPAGGTDVNTNGGGEHNELAVDDWTVWNEFWITIKEADDFNEYTVNIWANGSETPDEFLVTGGNGNDGGFGSYLAMGLHSTGQTGVLDVDFYAVAPGIHTPVANGGGGIRGDFNNDGNVDVADIDALNAEVRAGTNTALFDVTGDGLVTTADRDEWVVGIKNTYIGDANLDSEFNSSDFVLVFGAGEYEDAPKGNSTWAEGDWDGNGDFDSGDFVLAFQGKGYEQGPRAAAAVPEPAAGLSLVILGLLALPRRRR